jgi:hypothetical protein
MPCLEDFIEPIPRAGLGLTEAENGNSIGFPQIVGFAEGFLEIAFRTLLPAAGDPCASPTAAVVTDVAADGDRAPIGAP